MIGAAGGDPSGSASVIVQAAVLVTALGGALAAVLGALSSRRSKREAEASRSAAAEASQKSLGLEERTVARTEFDSVVNGLKAWAEALSSELADARDEIGKLSTRLTEREGEVVQLRIEVHDCHSDKETLRAEHAAERVELASTVQRLEQTIADLGATG